MDVRHCALSLVGEPIMYPRINEFVRLLHDRGISSFLVTNAQFPQELVQLGPVTQLYLSIDAPTRSQLEAVDRPIFEDFWERFLACIDATATRPERTVFRLTLVNGWNVDEVDAYADLVVRGKPDFVEIKGVTYAGKGDTSPLTIKNCPFHEEVASFAQDLASRISSKGIPFAVASEHAHSCSVLLANEAFRVDGRWHTWIDYSRFAELAQSGRDAIRATEYAAPAPEWATFRPDVVDGGFDPGETRVAPRGSKRTRQVAHQLRDSAAGGLPPGASGA